MKKKIVLYGDSLTDYFPMDKLNMPETTFINSGCAGETIAEIRARIKNDVLYYKPEIVILQGGANDFQLSFYPGPEKVARRLVDLGVELKLHLPECKLFIESLYPAYTKAIGNIPSWAKAKSNEEIIKINKEVRRLCEENNIIYVDIFSKLVGEDGQLPLDYTVDGIHLTREAYDIVAHSLKELLL